MEKNKIIYSQLEENEEFYKKEFLKSLSENQYADFSECLEIWNKNSSDKNVNEMFDNLKSNIEKFWLNPKYNNNINKEFNMLYFSHGGLFGGEIEAFAIDFNYDDDTLPVFDSMDERFNYLDNISAFPTCYLPLLIKLTNFIQDNTDKFENYSDANETYNFFEATTMRELHKFLKKADQENVFQSLKLKKPFYFAFAENDVGNAKLIYIIE